MNKILCAFLVFYATVSIVTCELQCYQCEKCENVNDSTNKHTCDQDLNVCVTEGTGEDTSRKCEKESYCNEKKDCSTCDESLCNSSGSVYPQFAMICTLMVLISMYRQ